MALSSEVPDVKELKPKIIVFGIGGAGGNAVNNMIQAGLVGVDFIAANTDAQALTLSKANRVLQMGVSATAGLGAGSQPEVGCAAAEEVLEEIANQLAGSHMVFITAGMGGGTGTGAAPVVARVARQNGILTVGVVTKPFQFEGHRRMRIAEAGLSELQKHVDTFIVIPNQNLFRVANERTTFADAFKMADQVLYSGVACITDLMVKEGLINLDFADVRSVMQGMGKAMMGTGEASGENRSLHAAEAAIANPLLEAVSMSGARGVLISISGGKDLTLFEIDEAANRVREEVDPEANIILGAIFDDNLDGKVRVSVVATGVEQIHNIENDPGPRVHTAQASSFLRSGADNSDRVSSLFSDRPPSTIPPLAVLKQHYAMEGDVSPRSVSSGPADRLDSSEIAIAPKPVERSSGSTGVLNDKQGHLMSRWNQSKSLPPSHRTPVQEETVLQKEPEKVTEEATETSSLSFFKRLASRLSMRRHDPEQEKSRDVTVDTRLASAGKDGSSPRPPRPRILNTPELVHTSNDSDEPENTGRMQTGFQQSGEHMDTKLEIPAFLRRRYY